MSQTNLVPSRNAVRAALAHCRPHFLAAACFSAVSNILYLIPSVYMMQVYDRVVPTGGLATLLALSLIAMAGLATLVGLEWLRARILTRASIRFDKAMAEKSLRAAIAQPGLDRVQRMEAMRNLDTLRQAIASPALIALLDAPWFPIYIIVASMLHPALGAMTFCSAALLLLLAWNQERSIRNTTRRASAAAVDAYAKQAHSTGHAADVRALGMTSGLTRAHLRERQDVNALNAEATFVSGNHGSFIKFLRLVLQSAALAVGAILAIQGNISAGSIFAASLLLSRALAPIEQVVGAWRTFLSARNAYADLSQIFGQPENRAHTFLPAPSGKISVENLSLATPSGDRVAVADISFTVEAGEVIGLVGHSGAGKSSLLRALAGAEPALRGVIRFDGAASTAWDHEELARYIGYVPQNFVLFPGTVKDNIASFRDATGEGQRDIDAAVVEAASLCCAHDMIVHLADGYDTRIGPGGQGLSPGQMQRIALARALYGRPPILLLDEPTANLDPDAQHAFIRTLSRLRADEVTVMMASHNTDILASVDKLLIMQAGRIARFGTVAETMEVRQPVSHTRKNAA